MSGSESHRHPKGTCFSPVLSSRGFIIFHFTLESAIRVELRFVKAVSLGGCVSFPLSMWLSSLLQHTVGKAILSPLSCLCSFDVVVIFPDPLMSLSVCHWKGVRWRAIERTRLSAPGLRAHAWSPCTCLQTWALEHTYFYLMPSC